jgi:hypothetical protein
VPDLVDRIADIVIEDHVQLLLERDKYKALAEELAEAVAHLRCCRTCAEDGEDCCENGGRQAIAALARYEQKVRA